MQHPVQLSVKIRHRYCKLRLLLVEESPLPEDIFDLA